jgi:adenosylhomocysteine nucleosidase
VRVVRTGIGAPRARAAIQILAGQGISGLLSVGTAGALAPDIAAGSLMLPQQVHQPDGGITGVDVNWHARLEALLRPHFQVFTGDILHTARIIRDSRTKQDFYARSGALAVDMESGALGELAGELGIPFLVLRIIADTASDRLPLAASDAVDAHGTVAGLALCGALLRRPAELVPMLRLMARFRRAGRNLHRAGRLAAPALFDPHGTQGNPGPRSL